MAATAAQIVGRMRGWSGRIIYQQILGSWDGVLGNVRRPDPDVIGKGDCTSTIQNAFLKEGGPDPGYYTQDMRTRGTRVASSNDDNFAAIQPGDVLIMQWRNGIWHAELAIDNQTCIGHPGPNAGPTEKNLRAYLGSAAYWEARRHPLATTAGGTTETTTEDNNEDEEEATMKGCTYKNGNTQVYMLFNESSGFVSEFSAGAGNGGMKGDYVNPIARNWGTNSWPTITASHANAIKRDLAKVREGKA